MLQLLFLIGLAILPPMILLLIIWGIDKSEREPKKLIILTFFFGALSCLPIAIAEAIGEMLIALPKDTIMFNFIDLFFVVAFAEELGKFMIAFLFVWRNKNFNYKYDGIVYCASASLGFATLENILYVLQSEYLEEMTNGGIWTGVLRCFTAIPLHCACGILMGAFFGLARMYGNQKKNKKLVLMIVLSLVVPMIVHGMYDFLAIVLGGILSLVAVVLIVGFLFIVCAILLIVFVSNDKKILLTPQEINQNQILPQYVQAQNYYMQQQMMRQQALQQMYYQQMQMQHQQQLQNKPQVVCPQPIQSNIQ